MRHFEENGAFIREFFRGLFAAAMGVFAGIAFAQHPPQGETEFGTRWLRASTRERLKKNGATTCAYRD
jgi:hypothetical protein